MNFLPFGERFSLLTKRISKSFFLLLLLRLHLLRLNGNPKSNPIALTKAAEGKSDFLNIGRKKLLNILIRNYMKTFLNVVLTSKLLFSSWFEHQNNYFQVGLSIKITVKYFENILRAVEFRYVKTF